MYSKAAWGGDVDPYILVNYMKQEGSDRLGSLLRYEWKDFGLIGQLNPEKHVEDADAVSTISCVRSTTILIVCAFTETLEM